jgi:hypothetical protein
LLNHLHHQALSHSQVEKLSKAFSKNLSAETPNKDGRIRAMLKTSIKPMLHNMKAQNLSILLTHLRCTPQEVARCMITGDSGKLDTCHLKTLLK